MQKQSLYDLLGLSPQAHQTQIEDAYQKLKHFYSTAQHGLSAEEALNKLKALQLAFDTLGNPTYRSAYDAKLLQQQPGDATESPEFLIPELMMPKKNTVKRHKKTLYGLLAMVFVGIVVQMYSVMATYHQVNAARAVASAPDKVRIQEYYQEHGVRATSIEQLKRWEEEDKLKNEEVRIEADLERQKNEKEMEYKRQRMAADQSIAEASRVGDEVSRRLREAEAQQARKAEDERRAREQAEADRKQAEQARIEAEKARYNRILNRPTTNDESN